VSRLGSVGSNVLFGLLMVAMLAVIGVVASSSLPLGVAPVKFLQVTVESMRPTVLPGEQVLYYRLLGGVHRGQVVVYRLDDGSILVGRVVGIPGDTVEVRNRALVLNGRPAEESYVRDPIDYQLDPVRVDAGRYFILGDNRNESPSDSHILGPIPAAQIVGGVRF